MTLRVANIFGIVLILLCSYSLQVRAQSESIGPKEPLKFDEFGSLRHCDLTARLDNFFIAVQSSQGATMQLVAYGPPAMETELLTNLKGYLVNSRGVNPEHIKEVYGGRNSDAAQLRIQLWVIPANTLPPEPEKFESNVATFKGKFFESEIYDDFGVWYENAEATGPGLIDESFADVLRNQQNAIGYIVAYNGATSLPGAWRRRAEQNAEALKALNIDASRLKVIFGGQSADAKLQLWILPKDAPPPVSAAVRESFPKEVMNAGELSADYLGYKGHEALSFKLLADVLRTDKKVRAFLVVRLDPPSPVEGKVKELREELEWGEDPNQYRHTAEPPDLTKLVEKWRTELTTTHKIRNDRIIVIFMPGTEENSNSIGLWFVPKGQPLPDPNKEEEAEMEEEEDPAPVKPN